MRKPRWVFLLLLCSITILLVGSAQAMSSPFFRLDWMVPLSGGGGTASSATYTAQFTVGQTALGLSANANHASQLGYWYGAYPYWHSYLLPLVSKSVTP